MRNLQFSIERKLNCYFPTIIKHPFAMANIPQSTVYNLTWKAPSGGLSQLRPNTASCSSKGRANRSFRCSENSASKTRSRRNVKSKRLCIKGVNLHIHISKLNSTLSMSRNGSSVMDRTHKTVLANSKANTGTTRRINRNYTSPLEKTADTLIQARKAIKVVIPYY
eukprot:TRINITY_DN11366_c0_g1_i1.p1 TRINITY_DN11366_c0_g1~~TRINITY_DN11366_c0_g1_i1.p1  ORF type:complete len:166 (-),score=16.84 TRINITY_DN11366_c0_g1_i1:89-586(-)